MKILMKIDIFLIFLIQMQSVLSVTLNLDSGQTIGQLIPGMSFRSNYADQGGTQSCRKGAVVKVDFAQAPCSAANHLACGNRIPRLKVAVHLNSNARDWLANIGDSVSNNGYGGDSGHEDNEAEIHLNGEQSMYSVFSYKRGQAICQTAGMHARDLFNKSVSSMTFYVADESYRVTTNEGDDILHCNDCLFALNNQPNGNFAVNKDIYISFNRVISSSSRKGYGLCSAELTWECINEDSTASSIQSTPSTTLATNGQETTRSTEFTTQGVNNGTTGPTDNTEAPTPTTPNVTGCPKETQDGEFVTCKTFGIIVVILLVAQLVISIFILITMMRCRNKTPLSSGMTAHMNGAYDSGFEKMT